MVPEAAFSQALGAQLGILFIFKHLLLHASILHSTPHRNTTTLFLPDFECFNPLFIQIFAFGVICTFQTIHVYMQKMCDFIFVER